MKARRGFTLMELLVVMSIIAVLAALLLPALVAARCHAKNSAARAMIQDFSVALKSYEADCGRFPPDEVGNYVSQGTPASLINLLSALGPKGVPYYQFTLDSISPAGKWITPVGTPFKYRENASKAKLPPGPLTMMNPYSFDVWGCACGDAPACDPSTSDPADKATLHNW